MTCVWTKSINDKWKKLNTPDELKFTTARDSAVMQLVQVLSPRHPQECAIALSGAGDLKYIYATDAELLGALIAKAGWDLLTGGLWGAMFFATQGFLKTQGQKTVGVMPKGRKPESENVRKGFSSTCNLSRLSQVHTELRGSDTAEPHKGPSSRNHVLICSAHKVVCMPGENGSIAEAELAKSWYVKDVLAFDPKRTPDRYDLWRDKINKLRIQTESSPQNVGAWLESPKNC